MTVNFWELAGSVGKWLGLLAVAGVIGGSFCLGLAQGLGFARLSTLLRYLLASAVLGVLAAGWFFLVQVGAINQDGVVGMLDTQMAFILAQSSLGHATGLRLLGFLSVMLAWYLFRQHRETGTGGLYNKGGFLALAAATVLLGVSFALTGHISTLAPLARTLVVLHVLAAFLWTGSLYPLLHLSTVADLPKVQRLMRCFGTSALLIVAVLLLSGIFLLTQVLHSFSDLFATDYGLTLLLKLAGASCLLALGAINKLLLVPRLTARNSASLLQASIKMEIVMALFILAVTTWLTTAVGPVKIF